MYLQWWQRKSFCFSRSNKPPVLCFFHLIKPLSYAWETCVYSLTLLLQGHQKWERAAQQEGGSHPQSGWHLWGEYVFVYKWMQIGRFCVKRNKNVCMLINMQSCRLICIQPEDTSGQWFSEDSLLSLTHPYKCPLKICSTINRIISETWS